MRLADSAFAICRSDPFRARYDPSPDANPVVEFLKVNSLPDAAVKESKPFGSSVPIPTLLRVNISSAVDVLTSVVCQFAPPVM